VHQLATAILKLLATDAAKARTCKNDTTRIAGSLAAAFYVGQGLVLACAPAMASQPAQHSETKCGPDILPINGNRIWARKQGAGRVTVVFEAGFGNDSSVWNEVEPRIRADGVQTLVYDRAGMGHSTIDTHRGYTLDNDVQILRTVLADCGISKPVVFVGHSYGGAIGLAASVQDPRIRGLVLLDAVVPGVWSQHEVEKNLASMRPQYDDIRKQAPDLAKVAIPWAEAMPRTANEINALDVPDDIPIIEIAAEKGQTDPASATAWRAAQTNFVAGHPARSFVLAKGSSHKVMKDKPDLVVSAIQQMIQRVAWK
jgi:pimeloyl-ACP methyl ester carboxylesterase